MDSSGGVLVVWVQQEGPRSNLWATRRDPDTGWGDPRRLETDDRGDAHAPRLVIDSNDNATVAWSYVVGTTSEIWTSRHRPGSGWTPGQPLQSKVEYVDGYAPAAIDVVQVSLAVGPAGDVHAVWSQYDGAGHDLYASRHAAASGWAAPQPLQSDVALSDGPDVTADAWGNARRKDRSSILVRMLRPLIRPESPALVEGATRRGARPPKLPRLTAT